MRTKTKKGKKARPKTRLGLPDLDQAKEAVLASLRSPESQRGYQHAMDEFIGWYCSELRLSFNKTVVTRYRINLEARQLAPGTVNVRLAAVPRCGRRVGADPIPAGARVRADNREIPRLQAAPAGSRERPNRH
jgi:hypothetical protein